METCTDCGASPGEARWSDGCDRSYRPGQVYLVQRDNLDGLYLFEDEGDRDAYAAVFPGAETGTAYVLNRHQAALRIAEHCTEHGESREDCGCADPTDTKEA